MKEIVIRRWEIVVNNELFFFSSRRRHTRCLSDWVRRVLFRSVDDAMARARSHLNHGASAEYCDECGEPIPEARRSALPGVRYCVKCQSALDKLEASHSGYNRRGSKDSQLR